MNRTLVIAAAVLCVAAVRPGSSELLAQINKEGARTVINQLWRDQSAFDAVCSAIESGEPTWLEVARRLKTASDAAVSESLNEAVARAIPRAPERVLRLIGKEFSVAQVCTSPYIEPQTGVAESYQRRAVAALKRVSATDLSEIRDECLAKISAPLVAQ